MDTQFIWNAIFTVAAGIFTIAIAVGGWFAREVWGAVKALQKDIHQIEVDLPSYYIRRDEFQDGLREIKDICRQIFDKVDSLEKRKADK